MLIQVTQDDIQNGERWNGHQCPIALAMFRAGIRFPSICRNTIMWYEDHEFKAIEPEPLVSKFINDFDNGYSVDPIEFELPIT
jgi:hypothetical protein